MTFPPHAAGALVLLIDEITTRGLPAIRHGNFERTLHHKSVTIRLRLALGAALLSLLTCRSCAWASLPSAYDSHLNGSIDWPVDFTVFQMVVRWIILRLCMIFLCIYGG